ncbi:hypothetical protein Dimus_008227, partial [Dionaea muscipula]
DLIWRKRVIRCKMVRESWMPDHGLNNVMELIKRQKWENLFKRREFVHVDVVKEFYARLTLIHYTKKEVAHSSVRGVEIEFDHMKLPSILDIPGNNGICEYIKDVWEESKYIKQIEITRKFANDVTIMAARRVKSSEMKPFQRFVHFLEAVVDEAADQRESGSGEKFYDTEDEIQEPATVVEEVPAEETQAQQKEIMVAGVDSGSSGHIPDSVMSKLLADFERARANRIQVDLERAQAENARLLALLQQAKSQPKP